MLLFDRWALLGAATSEEEIALYDAQTLMHLHTFDGHTSDVRSVRFPPDGQTLASGSYDQTVRLWSITSGKCLAVIQGFNGYVNSVAWYTNDEGEWLATGSYDKAMRLWQVHR